MFNSRYGRQKFNYCWRCFQIPASLSIILVGRCEEGHPATKILLQRVSLFRDRIDSTAELPSIDSALTTALPCFRRSTALLRSTAPCCRNWQVVVTELLIIIIIVTYTNLYKHFSTQTTFIIWLFGYFYSLLINQFDLKISNRDCSFS